MPTTQRVWTKFILNLDLSKVTGLHNEVWGDFAGVEGDVSHLTGNVSRIHGNVSGITGTLSGLRISTNPNTTDEEEHEVFFIVGYVTNISGDVSRLRGPVNALRGDVSVLYGVISSRSYGELQWDKHNNQFYAPETPRLVGSTIGKTGDLSGLIGDFSALRGDISGLRGEVTYEVWGDATGVTVNLDFVRGDLGKLSGRLSSYDRRRIEPLHIGEEQIDLTQFEVVTIVRKKS